MALIWILAIQIMALTLLTRKIKDKDEILKGKRYLRLQLRLM